MYMMSLPAAETTGYQNCCSLRSCAAETAGNEPQVIQKENEVDKEGIYSILIIENLHTIFGVGADNCYERDRC